MPDLNLILMAGNLTNDPKYSETKTGTPVVNFYMASNKRFKDRNGTIKEDVCFVGVVAWDNL
ncbi:MAG: single-stranded DNA-binding protein, partial [Candidatus Marinimicrobia bacterium]|nr:single-stranded DNA-binding protein [Candidatus Neomarinimicrobiota bacterium]